MNCWFSRERSTLCSLQHQWHHVLFDSLQLLHDSPNSHAHWSPFHLKPLQRLSRTWWESKYEKICIPLSLMNFEHIWVIYSVTHGIRNVGTRDFPTVERSLCQSWLLWRAPISRSLIRLQVYKTPVAYVSDTVDDGKRAQAICFAANWGWYWLSYWCCWNASSSRLDRNGWCDANQYLDGLQPDSCWMQVQNNKSTHRKESIHL